MDVVHGESRQREHAHRNDYQYSDHEDEFYSVFDTIQSNNN